MSVTCTICAGPMQKLSYDHIPFIKENKCCFKCYFWHEHVENRNSPDVARIDGKHYIIGTERAQPRSCRGFAGRPFTIKFLSDGRIVNTTNLWYQGEIPANLQDKLPNNAEFIGNSA